jgi:hypothetical protein
MNIEEYLAIMKSYIDSNLQSAIDSLPKENLKRVGGLVLTHLASISASNPNKILIRESAFRDYEKLESIFVSDGKVANDIYISPLASSGPNLIIQIHIDSWVDLSSLNKDVLFVRSHGLSMVHNFKDESEKYQPLPSYQIVPDDQKWIVDPLDLSEIPKECREQKATLSLMQILEGFEITEDFKNSLRESFFEENNNNTLSVILEMLGLVEIEGAIEILNKYLSSQDKDLRMTAFVSAIKIHFENLRDPLISCYRDEMDTDNRFIMLKNIVSRDKLSIREISDLIAGLDLTKRETRLLEKNKILI